MNTKMPKNTPRKHLQLERKLATEREKQLTTELATFFLSRDENGKTKECTEKALAIRKEISDRKGQADDYRN